MASDIKKKTLSSLIWNALQRFGTIGINFISNIILARLLTPDDFGAIGMLMIFIALSNTFIDGGFGSALIQKKDPTQEDYSTIFYWNILFSIFIYIILYASSPAISSFYNLPILTNILRIQGIVLIINALSIIQINQLRKKLQFKKLALINISSSILSVILAIYLAYSGWGVWSLVFQQLSFGVFLAILAWVSGKWVPSLIFSWNSFKALFNFGSFMLLSSFINTLFNNINSLIIGRLFNASTMGYFTQAKKIEDATAMSITNVVEQVTYPILSEHQNDKERMRNILKRFNTSTFYIVTPMMLMMCLFAEPIIVFLFTEKWLYAAPYLKILALHGIPMGLQGVNYNAIAAIGKSKTIFVTTITKRIMTVILMLIGVYIGAVKGLLWGMVISSCLIILYNMYLISRYLEYRIITQIKELSGIAIISLGTFLLVLGLQKFLSINTVILTVIFIIIYMLFSFIFRIEVFRDIVNFIASKIKKGNIL